MYLNALLPITNFTIQIGDASVKLFALGLGFIAFWTICRILLDLASSLRLRINFGIVIYFISFLYFAIRTDDLYTATYIVLMYFVYIYNKSLSATKMGAAFSFFVVLFALTLYFALPDNCYVSDYRVPDRSVFANDVCAVRYESDDMFRLMGFGSDPNHWSLFIVSILFIYSRLGSNIKFAAFISNIFTFSRSGLLSSLLVLIERVGISLKIALIVLIVIPSFVALLIIRDFDFDLNTFSRFLIWASYLNQVMLSDFLNIIFGNGANLTYTISVDDYDFDRAPHNTLILVLYQFGIFGVVLYAMMLYRVKKSIFLFIPFIITLDLFYSPVYWMLMGLVENKSLDFNVGGFKGEAQQRKTGEGWLRMPRHDGRLNRQIQVARCTSTSAEKNDTKITAT
jgi:hypothetical protein